MSIEKTPLPNSPLSDLSPSIQHAIFANRQTLTMQKGQPLLDAFEPWRHVYWLHSGMVRMFYLDTYGREHNKRFFLANDFFWPVTTGLRTQEAGFYIQALSEIRYDMWDYSTFRNAFPNDSDWLAFSHLWLERLADSKLARERDWLHLSAAERYQKLCNETPNLIEQVPAHHIASYLGITPVSLSRIKNS